MSVTIELNGPLAEQLQTKASNRSLSPQDFACTLLTEALQKTDENEQWQSQNERRIALIKKSTAGVITAAETDELQALQEAADHRLEERDRQLLDGLSRFQEAARKLAPDKKAN